MNTTQRDYDTWLERPYQDAMEDAELEDDYRQRLSDGHLDFDPCKWHKCDTKDGLDCEHVHPDCSKDSACYDCIERALTADQERWLDL